jgi:hypothetical protein
VLLDDESSVVRQHCREGRFARARSSFYNQSAPPPPPHTHTLVTHRRYRSLSHYCSGFPKLDIIVPTHRFFLSAPRFVFHPHNNADFCFFFYFLATFLLRCSARANVSHSPFIMPHLQLSKSLQYFTIIVIDVRLILVVQTDMRDNPDDEAKKLAETQVGGVSRRSSSSSSFHTTNHYNTHFLLVSILSFISIQLDRHRCFFARFFHFEKCFIIVQIMI